MGCEPPVQTELNVVRASSQPSEDIPCDPNSSLNVDKWRRDNPGIY